MANINNLAMGSTLAACPQISTVSRLFGIISYALYTPTGSRLATYTYEYPADREAAISNLLALKDDKLAQAARQLGTLKSDALGNLRLEACVSADHRFAALQLFRYNNFEAVPLSKLKIFYDADARAIAALL